MMLPRIELVGGPRCGDVVESPTAAPPLLLKFLHRDGQRVEVCRYTRSTYYARTGCRSRADYVYQFRGHGR